jgi:nucleoside-diphosphate-sugar epimerase
MRLFVTGAGGFLGSEIVRQAAAAGMRVRAMVRRGRPDLPAVAEYVSGDLLRHAELASMISGSDCVIHAAGLAHVFGKVRDSVDALERNNGEGTANATVAARGQGFAISS